MPEDVKQQIEDARERGRFEGQVLTSLSDIKSVLVSMDKKHTEQDVKIEGKASKEDLIEAKNEIKDLNKRVWGFSGAASALAFIAGKIFN